MIRRTISLIASILVLGILTASCGETDTVAHPEINYGRDICIQCGMIIDDPRFAAVYRVGDGTERKFDDLGGLVLHAREKGELDSAEVWVSDFDEEVLMDASSAYYVPTLGVVSPMGHGLLAFGDRARAEKAATDLGGEVITWEVVKTLRVTDGLVGEHHASGHEGHSHEE